MQENDLRQSARERGLRFRTMGNLDGSTEESRWRNRGGRLGKGRGAKVLGRRKNGREFPCVFRDGEAYDRSS